VHVSSLLTREHEERLSPNFQVVQGCHGYGFKHKNGGVVGRGQKIGVFRLSLDGPAGKEVPMQIGHLALDTQAQTH